MEVSLLSLVVCSSGGQFAITGGVFMWRSVCYHWWCVHVEFSLLSLVVCSSGGQFVFTGGVFMWKSVCCHW